MNLYQEQIAELEGTLDQLAHSMAKGLDFEAYLMQIGKYRALRDYKLKIEEKLKKREVIEDSEPLGAQVEEPTIRRPVAVRPRSWGGGRSRP